MVKEIRKLIANPYHLFQAIIASYYYGFPSRDLKMIGITGTNGKTTTAYLIGSILETAGKKVGWITTLSIKIGDKMEDNKAKMTTLPAVTLQSTLAKMKSANCEFVVMEVTSHALDQHRVWGISYDTTVFTNLTHEHLDYHGTLNKYKNAKLKLFQSPHRVSVVNIADPEYKDFLLPPAQIKLGYCLTDKADIYADNINLKSDGSAFTLVTKLGSVTINLPMPGKFNISNALAATGACLGQGVSLNLIKKGLEQTIKPSGRMETLRVSNGATIVVDFAHTPDALEKLFEAIMPAVKGKVILVFGATGRRDTTKRPIMGEIANKYANDIILTTDDPYDEDQHVINQDIASTIDIMKVTEILDRRQAISEALKRAGKDDIILVTGKGGETVMAVGHKLIPWSDKSTIEQLLEG